MAQQTAMQKFITNLESIGITVPLGVQMVYLQIEKEQMIKSWHNGYENQSPMIDEDNCGQTYYNETYK